MPDGSTHRPLPTWPALARPYPGEHFSTKHEAIAKTPVSTGALDIIRDRIEGLFNQVRDRAEFLLTHGHADSVELSVLREVLEGLLDLDSNTTKWVLEQQAEAEEWLLVED